LRFCCSVIKYASISETYAASIFMVALNFQAEFSYKTLINIYHITPFYMPNGSILHIHCFNNTKLRTIVSMTEAIFFSMQLNYLDIESFFCSQRTATLCIPFECYFVRELIAVMRYYCTLNVSIKQRTGFKFNLVHFFIMDIRTQ